ncbi:MAG: LuxR family transcriptional regulator [Deltaproteobacteria bacterium]|nr:LuxR family transcriptional regulator [Deltaproteobacteria bacterium]MBW2079148.1 LuxR family transcriptional regulator [Deltaproteobacteria bacterium]
MAKQKTPSHYIDLSSLLYPEKALRFLLPIPDESETDPAKIEVALLERIKELNCMYAMAILAERYSDSIEDFLRNLVSILPPSWQYPEITCARITFDGATYKSPQFRVSKWRQSSRILIYNEPMGEVEVFYLEERPPEDEGPFLKEERLLLDTVAEQIGKTAVRISAEQELRELNKQLTVERKALQEANAALKAVLQRIEEEKTNIKKNVQANVEKILMPILHALSMELPRSQRTYVEILRTNLEEIVSPFVNQLSRRFLSLTPTEIKICRLIRSGMRTKEIAGIQGVSTATINRHREHIRRKLDIINRNVNLATYLQSSMWEEERTVVGDVSSIDQDRW